MTKSSTIIALLLLLPLSVSPGHSQQSNLLELVGPYLGQEPPSNIPELFVAGVTSTAVIIQPVSEHIFIPFELFRNK